MWVHVQRRSLPAHEVLQLLRRQPGDLLWQYLEHLVAGCGSHDPEAHTELASALAAAAAERLPPPSPRARPAKRRAGASSGANRCVGLRHVAQAEPWSGMHLRGAAVVLHLAVRHER